MGFKVLQKALMRCMKHVLLYIIQTIFTFHTHCSYFHRDKKKSVVITESYLTFIHSVLWSSCTNCALMFALTKCLTNLLSPKQPANIGFWQSLLYNPKMEAFSCQFFLVPRKQTHTQHTEAFHKDLMCRINIQLNLSQCTHFSWYK